MRAWSRISLWAAACGRVRAFRRDEGGQIAIMFAASITGLIIATGAGLDLTRAFQARQMLYQVATMACQYASRPSVVQMAHSTYSAGSNGPTYGSAVGSYITAALQSQTFPWTQTNTTPFTYTVSGPADVNLTAEVPTAFMQIVQVSGIPVSARSHCYDTPSSITQRQPNGGNPYLIQEGFEGGSGVRYMPIPGRTNTTPSTTFTQTANFTGVNGTAWYSTGYCLETDPIGAISATLPEGVRSAELDCENGSNSAGNSATSAKVYLPVGNYELRYHYRGRVGYPTYDPVYICGSSASDVAWANDTRITGGPVENAVRSNQMNVYLDQNITGSPPMHTTLFGGQQLAGSNLIDVCVHSINWIERSVRIYISTPAYYWLTFAADGQNDSFGAQLDNIRLCTESCPGTMQDNFPAAWLVAGKTLFQDTFESPTYSANYYNVANTSGNLNNSVGTSGTSASGWPALATSGWATAPHNSVIYLVTGSAQGTQSIQLDASSPSTTNRLASRPFLLVPGYYKVEYRYVSDILFTGLNASYCGSTPSAANIAALSGTADGRDRFLNSTVRTTRDTNIVALFMSHADLASTPIGGGALNSATSYLNPNGTTTTTPTVAPNALSLTSYNAGQVNPLLDICGYASSWQTRTANILIKKPGYYWLTAAAFGTADAFGGAIDDLKLTALGSPYMTTPPTGAVAIPVADPQPGSVKTASDSSFYTIANPLTPTAPLQ